MAFLITTTGLQSPVVFNDLSGRSFTHPTVDYDLEIDYSQDEISESIDLQTAIDNNWITAKDAEGNPILEVSTISSIPTITQADAEGGTDQMRRIYTAERAKQTVKAQQTFYSVEFPFAFNTASPVDSAEILPIGHEIVRADIDIDTPFDDPSATLRLVVGGGPVILETDRNDPAEVSDFSAPKLTPLAVSGPLRLIISPAGSTQGSGRVVATVKRS